MNSENGSAAPTGEANKIPRQEHHYAIEKVINFRNLVVFATFLSVIFQSARLYAISPPLRAYITLGDALLKIAVVMPSFAFTAFLFVNLVEDFADRMRRGEPYGGSKGHQLTIFFSFIISAVAVIAIGVALYRVPISDMTFVTLSPYLKAIASGIVFLILIWVLIHVLWTLCVMRHNAEISGTITDREVMTLFVFGLSGAVVFGALSTIYGKPDYCEIKTADAVHNAYFLAALQSVTALDIDGQTVIMSNSQIKQINCDIPRPSKDAQK